MSPLRRLQEQAGMGGGYAGPTLPDPFAELQDNARFIESLQQGVPQQQAVRSFQQVFAQARQPASQRGLAMDELRKMAVDFRAGRLDPRTLQPDRARQLQAFLQRLAGAGSDDPEIARQRAIAAAGDDRRLRKLVDFPEVVQEELVPKLAPYAKMQPPISRTGEIRAFTPSRRQQVFEALGQRGLGPGSAEGSAFAQTILPLLTFGGMRPEDVQAMARAGGTPELGGGAEAQMARRRAQIMGTALGFAPTAATIGGAARLGGEAVAGLGGSAQGQAFFGNLLGTTVPTALGQLAGGASPEEARAALTVAGGLGALAGGAGAFAERSGGWTQRTRDWLNQESPTARRVWDWLDQPLFRQRSTTVPPSVEPGPTPPPPSEEPPTAGPTPGSGAGPRPGPNRPPPGAGVQPPLRDLYRATIRNVHPDLAPDDEARALFTEWSKRANAAYAAGDAEGLNAVLSEFRVWQAARPSAPPPPSSTADTSEQTASAPPPAPGMGIAQFRQRGPQPTNYTWQRPSPAQADAIAGALPIATPPPAVAKAVSGDIPGIAVVPTDQIRVDPERFQYKVIRGREGATGSLSSAATYNPDLAGVSLAWRDPASGEIYIVNGHNRLALARRSGTPEMLVRLSQAQTAQEAAAEGALMNIAEGRGTATDAASFFRNTGMTAKDIEAHGVTLREKVASDGLALANLNPTLFGAVVRGQYPTERAVIIGREVTDHDAQNALVKLIEREEKRGRRITNDTVQELAEQTVLSPTTATTISNLFGESEVAQNLALERADVMSFIKRQLHRDQRLFGVVSASRNVQRLLEEGNEIDVGRAKQISNEAAIIEDVFNRLKNSVGDVSTAISDAARKVAAGENANAARQKAYQTVREAVLQAVSRSQGETPPVAEAGGGAAQPPPGPPEEGTVTSPETPPPSGNLFSDEFGRAHTGYALRLALGMPAGVLIGSQIGETREERERNALIGMMAGAGFAILPEVASLLVKHGIRPPRGISPPLSKQAMLIDKYVTGTVQSLRVRGNLAPDGFRRIAAAGQAITQQILQIQQAGGQVPSGLIEAQRAIGLAHQEALQVLREGGNATGEVGVRLWDKARQEAWPNSHSIVRGMEDLMAQNGWRRNRALRAGEMKYLMEEAAPREGTLTVQHPSGNTVTHEVLFPDRYSPANTTEATLKKYIEDAGNALAAYGGFTPLQGFVPWHVNRYKLAEYLPDPQATTGWGQRRKEDIAAAVLAWGGTRIPNIAAAEQYIADLSQAVRQPALRVPRASYSRMEYHRLLRDLPERVWNSDTQKWDQLIMPEDYVEAFKEHFHRGFLVASMWRHLGRHSEGLQAVLDAMPEADRYDATQLFRILLTGSAQSAPSTVGSGATFFFGEPLPNLLDATSTVAREVAASSLLWAATPVMQTSSLYTSMIRKLGGPELAAAVMPGIIEITPFLRQALRNMPAVYTAMHTGLPQGMQLGRTVRESGALRGAVASTFAHGALGLERFEPVSSTKTAGRLYGALLGAVHTGARSTAVGPRMAGAGDRFMRSWAAMAYLMKANKALSRGDATTLTDLGFSNPGAIIQRGQFTTRELQEAALRGGELVPVPEPATLPSAWESRTGRPVTQFMGPEFVEWTHGVMPTIKDAVARKNPWPLFRLALYALPVLYAQAEVKRVMRGDPPTDPVDLAWRMAQNFPTAFSLMQRRLTGAHGPVGVLEPPAVSVPRRLIASPLEDLLSKGQAGQRGSLRRSTIREMLRLGLNFAAGIGGMVAGRAVPSNAALAADEEEKIREQQAAVAGRSGF